MQITQDELDRIVIPYNYVLLRLPQTYDDLRHYQYEKDLGGDKSIKVKTDTNFGGSAFDTPRIGMVVKNPESLFFWIPSDREYFAHRDPSPEESRNIRNSLPHKTEIETQVGDIVICDYMGIKLALGKLIHRDHNTDDQDYYRVGETVYVRVRYDNLLVAMRGGHIYCLNGSVIASKVRKEIETGMEIPDFCIVDDPQNPGEFITKPNEDIYEKNLKEVVYCGSCNTDYIDNYLVKDVYFTDADGLAQGDIVIHKSSTPKMLNKWHDLARDISILGGERYIPFIEKIQDTVYLYRKSIYGVK